MAGVAIATAAVCDLKRLAQLADDDSETARDLATSIRLNLQQWKEGPNITVPDLEQLLNAQVTAQRLVQHSFSVRLNAVSQPTAT